MEEIWKDIKGYEGLYQVSSLGRVRRDGKILKSGLTRGGYLQVHLSKNGKVGHYKIHRLVAEAFLQNLDNNPEVNHKDENKLNNTAENLEWCTSDYNLHYGTRIQRYSQTQRDNGTSKSRAVKQYTIDGVLLNSWNSIRNASRYTGIDSSAICGGCNGKYRVVHGYVWRYAEDDFDKYTTSSTNKVLQYNKNMELIKEWGSIKEASMFYGCDRTAIRNCCLGKTKTSCGYIWKYKNNI